MIGSSSYRCRGISPTHLSVTPRLGKMKYIDRIICIIYYSEARKLPIKEFHFDRILEGFGMDKNQFIDLCILLGCDYCDKIRGIGPKNAIKLVQEHKNIEKILKQIDSKKFTVPENWKYEGARQLFKEPEVKPASEIDLKWEKPDEEGLVKFMAEQNGFAEDRIRNGAKRLLKAKQGSTQGRLDSFFKVLPPTPNQKVENKRKSDDKMNGANKKLKGGNAAAKKGVFRR